MDIKQLRVSQAPRLTKTIVFLLFVVQVGVGFACAYWFLRAPNGQDSALIQSAAYSLGAGVPLLALSLILLTVRTGFRAIETRVTEILLDLIPRKLSQLDLLQHDPASRAIEFRGKRLSPSQFRKYASPIRLSVSLSRDATTAHYLIETDRNGAALRLWFSVDIQLSQATVCLRIPERALLDTQSIADCCPSTLHGAVNSGNYKVDPKEFTDRLDGVSMRTLILRKPLESDGFLWDTAAIYSFAADLVLMVSSFMKECASPLGRNPQPASQG